MGAGESAAWNRAVFAIGQTTVTVADVIDAAHFRGEVASFSSALIALEKCDERDVDEAALQSMSEQFRVERDLITAEETERWLGERGLTLDDFSSYFLRHIREDATDEKIEPDGVGCTSDSAEFRDLLRVELLLSGEFDRMAVRLAWRMAAHAGAVGGRARVPEGPRLDDATLATLGRERVWLDEMLNFEATYQQQCDALLTGDARERMLNALRLPLMRLELETMDLESRDAAREAFLCIHEDGLPLSELAETGRYPCRRVEVVCEDLPADLQRKLLCAAPGEVLEPIERGDGFQLCRLIQKIEPDLSNAQTRERVEQRILEGHFSELAAGRIVWMIAPGSIYDRPSR